MSNVKTSTDTSEYGIPSVGDFFWFDQELFKGDFHEVLALYKRLNPSKKWRIWLIDNGYRVQVVPMPNPVENDMTVSYFKGNGKVCEKYNGLELLQGLEDGINKGLINHRTINDDMIASNAPLGNADDFWASNYRIAVNSFQHGLEIQAALFKLGGKWQSFDFIYRQVTTGFILARGRALYYAETERGFEEDDFATETTLAELQEVWRRIHEDRCTKGGGRL